MHEKQLNNQKKMVEFHHKNYGHGTEIPPKFSADVNKKECRFGARRVSAGKTPGGNGSERKGAMQTRDSVGTRNVHKN